MMMEIGLLQRLSTALAAVASVAEEDDGGLTVTYGDAVASLRVVTITEGLDMVSLTQLLAWDLPLTDEFRRRVAEQAARTVLGTVVLVEKAAAGTADVVLRYNFPATSLTADALGTLVVLVLEGGTESGAALKR
jgi:hypothetical protein